VKTWEHTQGLTLIIFAGLLIHGSLGPTVAQSGSEKDHQADAASPPGEQAKFQVIRRSLGLREDGGTTTTVTYRAPDNEEVNLTKSRFMPPDGAEKQLEKLIKMATAIIERSSTKTGGTTEERSVLTVPVKGETKPYTVIVLIRDGDFWEIGSLSSKDALAFENQWRRDIQPTAKNTSP
jgi:hypothetical protein